MEEKSLTSSTIANNRIETLDNHQSISSSNPNSIDQLNTLSTNKITDGQYTFTRDSPPILIYYLRLPFETLLDAVRIQSEPELNLLKIFIEQQERNSLVDERLIVRSTSRLCRLPKDHQYDYTCLRVQFLKENFIRIEIPTLYQT